MASLLSTTLTASTRRATQHLVSCVPPANMSSSSQKEWDPSRKANGQYFLKFCMFTLLNPNNSYANTNYVVVRSTSHNPKTKKVTSYNIMCQWSVNLQKCLEEFPLKNAERLDDQIVAHLVPKFHLAAHKENCQINFSLNYKPGVGRSDMEGPERTWFSLQGGGSTKDQGPGYWSDMMDDKFGHWNWSKLICLSMNSYFSFLLWLVDLSI